MFKCSNIQPTTSGLAPVELVDLHADRIFQSAISTKVM